MATESELLVKIDISRSTILQALTLHEQLYRDLASLANTESASVNYTNLADEVGYLNVEARQAL